MPSGEGPFFGILIKTISARLVVVPFYNLTVVGNANGKFILTPTVPVEELRGLDFHHRTQGND